MSSQLHAAMVGFDFTPKFHPEFGAWGTTPIMTEVDLPLLGRCLALEQDGRRLVWLAFDLCGNTPSETARSALDITLGALRLGNGDVARDRMARLWWPVGHVA